MSKILLISVYASQSIPDKRLLLSYLSSIISQWDGDCIVMGDFNEVRYVEERMGSLFNPQGATEFNSFINNSGLIDVHLEGYSFTWAHPSASKMSKLDRFLVIEGIISSFPCIFAVCLDKHWSDHRPILLRDVVAAYGAIPFRFFNSWLHLDGFGQMVSNTWSSIDLDDINGMIGFKKKLQILKKEIRVWVATYKKIHSGRLSGIQTKLRDIDVVLDQGGANDSILSERKDLLNKPNDLKSSESREYIQKALDLELPVCNDEIRRAVWHCGNDKSPGPDGFTFEFFRAFWNIIGPDFCLAVDWFFQHHSFAKGCNSSFVALIPKINDPKIVNDYRPISLIGSIY
uniref:RNA-directed DNA polymerase, eukaryota n=1 Tax=Tanacetum cinerariifolium TaxID=118510 RepID=A0A699I3I6_TANCI|nr:RNA-directed DNA polymerase, eukaryota [Tanacetum cinerariifolium]